MYGDLETSAVLMFTDKQEVHGLNITFRWSIFVHTGDIRARRHSLAHIPQPAWRRQSRPAGSLSPCATFGLGMAGGELSAGQPYIYFSVEAFRK